MLRSAIQNAKLGCEAELAAVKRLDDQARLVERCASGAPLEEVIGAEFSLTALACDLRRALNILGVEAMARAVAA